MKAVWLILAGRRNAVGEAEAILDTDEWQKVRHPVAWLKATCRKFSMLVFEHLRRR